MATLTFHPGVCSTVLHPISPCQAAERHPRGYDVREGDKDRLPRRPVSRVSRGIPPMWT
jgi:hypothetical protein